ncbi:glycosyltransferase family 2 protein [Lactobacillus delbrueckii]|uniref:glycosyltransferase family 2 protein n=1 Tax=Lactobacillus delbrueckii TaxID=1584 RepID=UPI00358DB581
MQSRDISVIVPVYNVEAYLDRCLESIINQDSSNYEVIIVDDGSTDNSGKIADSYSKKYTFITTIHKKMQDLALLEIRGWNTQKESIFFSWTRMTISKQICYPFYMKQQRKMMQMFVTQIFLETMAMK